MENDFAGEVRFFFQQAEEIGQGARQFVAAGLLEGVDRIYGQHVTNTLNVGRWASLPDLSTQAATFSASK